MGQIRIFHAGNIITWTDAWQTGQVGSVWVIGQNGFGLKWVMGQNGSGWVTGRNSSWVKRVQTGQVGTQFLPFEKRDGIFIKRVKYGNLKVPRTWPASQELTRFRSRSDNEDEDKENVNAGDGRSYVENSKVSESLLLMKFYSLSSGVVNHLLSGKDIDLPMQVTDEQMNIILFSKSSFIIGRSGTGKTTILTMKLFQKEQLFRVSSEGLYEESKPIDVMKEVDDDLEESKPTVLHQLFVTVSPKLCYAVKQHVSQLTNISSSGNSLPEINLSEADMITSDFDEILDTFIDIPVKSYPLVITFHKFLMMLDATLGNSFFERFQEAREGTHGNNLSLKSVALQTFIRKREVTFDRFCSLYWSHFNTNFTKKLDRTRVFTEIISHIKGGLQAGKTCDGKMSFEGYVSLSGNRSSTLTKKKRETIYNLFQAYEKMKTERGDFDLGDLVNNIHHRLKNGTYEGDRMVYVYIDEVQDLSMRQLSLFKYICQNVDEGFVFAGDTAQTIARGIDFRFQDIRSLFYKEFLATQTNGKQAKGIVSEVFQLKQNFRTHDGVLDLAQSVIELLYRYFAHSIDILEPETSLISGEAPVLLESGNDENAIVTIFGGSGTGSGGEIVGFGAEQVILVRDDDAKTEIWEYVGKNALVLTIVECKGLEFQDVLLYKFFGTSPLKDQWRVIYEYMKERDWLDEKLPQSFPNFSESRHSVLCSELKQLYVAITRTRQRLWICENKEELSKPIFDYWKMRGLVQVRKLDDSVAQAMRVASSPQEWRDRGKKLFYESNFVMATMCFERAGDAIWEKLAKASGLRASADQMRGTNHEAFVGYLREAAGMFESIARHEPAASCYCDLEEYEKAGKIYLYKCGKMEAAAECFTLAGCYGEAAEAYAKGDKFSDCLSVCKNGKLFDKGLQYIEKWKQLDKVQTKELEQIEQQFLEGCANDFHERKDHKSMMKFVRAFCSMESKRTFLKSINCLDDLLLLEEEAGHFLDAAELARSWGDVLKEAELLEKAGRFKDASVLLLWHMFLKSLWGNGSRGWPLKQFSEKERFCEKVKSLAKKDSNVFFDFVCCELKVLSDQPSSLSEVKKDLHACRAHNSLRGEIFSIRKIMDSHFSQSSSKYEWEDELPTDNKKHCENKISRNRVSVRTLVFYWNMWKQNAIDIFESLARIHDEELGEHEGRVAFCLNLFGVRKLCVESNIVYLLVNDNVDWIKFAGQKAIRKDGKVVLAELLSVGFKVLENLDALRKSKSKGSAFHRSTSLLHIFEVSKFLLDCKYLNLPNLDDRKLKTFLNISLSYFDLVFPLDWRKSMSYDLVSLKETDVSVSLLDEIILQSVNVKGDITFSTIGRLMKICLGSRKSAHLLELIVNKLQRIPAWKLFVEKIKYGSLNDAYVTESLRNALDDTFKANWRVSGYISPDSFVHLLDRLLLLESLSLPFFFTTKSCYVTSPPLSSSKNMISEHVVFFLVETIQHILYNKEDTILWIKKSNIDCRYFHPLLALKLVMIMCLICLQVPDCSNVILDLLLGYNNVSYLLPKTFALNLQRRRKGRNMNLNIDVVAEAFASVDDPLLVVSCVNSMPRTYASRAIYVDLRKSKDEIMNQLFPRKTKCSGEDSSSQRDDS
ncbi:uncharacterized protein [Rutidosis leptorrhynchoides]|uniref:uncharacterized protein n=1 Tax=Rutidosis leptorrhynchoides TaxID=125765 RepID=UPI003A9A05DB